MFSQLGPLFKTHLRQAESTDARLSIRRDEKQDQGKKNGERSEEDTGSELWDDTTSVSVEALRTFLIEFLKTRGDSIPDVQVRETGAPDASNGRAQPPANPKAARAARAYAATAGQSQYEPPPISEEIEETTTDLADLLKADELRTIHILIHELELLARKGVQTLTIEKAETFLESLVQAVRLEKTKG